MSATLFVTAKRIKFPDMAAMCLVFREILHSKTHGISLNSTTVSKIDLQCMTNVTKTVYIMYSAITFKAS